MNKKNKLNNKYMLKQIEVHELQHQLKSDANYLKNNFIIASGMIKNFGRLSIINPYEAEEFQEISEKLEKLHTRIVTRLNSPIL